MAHIVERLLGHYGMFGGGQVTTLADATALPGALADVRPTIFIGVPRVWEKLKVGIDALVACEPDSARRLAAQKAFGVGLQYVDVAQAGQVPARLAEAYRRADEQVMSQIRLLLGLDQVRIAVSGAAPIAPEILTFTLALGIPCRSVSPVPLPGRAELCCRYTF
jgi:long-chain acyl-CoA synthetase